ncbi:hypothetical protein BC828DRAFT_410130 [Blastocladiella britannica]|nr:hypothetical protein BC828DRAFT_410130 [Blastocladiella britannica]
MFSGHTVMLTLMAMLWTDYGPKTTFVRVGIWTLATGGILSLLALRFHYQTIDVLIAFHLTQQSWRYYGFLVQSRTLRESDPIVAYLERRSSEADFRTTVRVLREKRDMFDTKVTEVRDVLRETKRTLVDPRVEEIMLAVAQRTAAMQQGEKSSSSSSSSGIAAPSVIAAAAAAANTAPTAGTGAGGYTLLVSEATATRDGAINGQALEEEEEDDTEMVSKPPGVAAHAAVMSADDNDDNDDGTVRV